MLTPTPLTLRKTLSNVQKQAVAGRARHCCEYCLSQLRFSPDPFSVEHIVPLAQGGSDQLDNLALACQGCNSHKYTTTESLDPASGLRTPLFHPRRDAWSQHFTWSDDYSLIIGVTPIGRATVAKLELNREGVVNLRRVLGSSGEHPPY